MAGPHRTLLFALTACAATLAVGAERTITPSIDITATRDILQVEYRLTRPAAGVLLAPIDNAALRSGWKTASSGIVLNERTLRRIDGAAFDHASVSIAPDTVSIDRAYPQALRVGEGWQVHGPYLAADQGTSHASFHLPPGWIAVPRQPLGGSFYVGPAIYLRQGIVSPPSIPTELRSAVATALHDANSAYAAKFTLTAPKPPLVILTTNSLERGWRGDSTAGVLSLRFAEPAVRPPPAADAIGRFVAHELFHHWWKGSVLPLAGEKGSWVEEGMAEYAALLISGETTTVSAKLARHLNGCRDGLAPDGLLTAPPTGGQTVYDCGVVFQWIRDLQWRSASGGRDDVFAGWRDLLRRFRRTGRAAVWREAIAARPAVTKDDPADLLLSPATDRWPRVVAALNGLGAQIVAARNDGDLRVTVLKHLLSSVCHDRMGFYTQTKSVKLDTGDHCGPLNGDPVVDAVGGHNLFDDPAGAFAEVTRLCAGNKLVTLEAGGRSVATLPCTKPIKPPPDRWSVEVWRPGSST